MLITFRGGMVSLLIDRLQRRRRSRILIVRGSTVSVFQAVEAGIRAGSPEFAGSSRTEWLRIGANRVLQTGLLQPRIPSLINSPGITQIGGVPLVAPYFNENKPLRDLPPVINDVVGAMDIQRVLDYEIWINQPADAGAYAPHLRKTPLPGMTARPVLFLVAKGDQTVGVPAP